MNRKARRAAQSGTPQAGSSFEALFGEALRLHQTGRLDQATTAYRRTITAYPDFAPAHNNLAALLLSQGHPADAARSFARALELTPELFDSFGEIAATLFRVNPALQRAAAAADAAWPRLVPERELFDAAGLAAIGADPLLRLVLVSAPVRDVPLERLLTSVRKALLARAAASEPVDAALLEFACALARQCFINEYVFALGDEERAAADALRARVAQGQGVEPLAVAIAASYAPLGELVQASALLERKWPDCLARVLTQQMREPQTEQGDRERIPRLTEIADGVSTLVRRQYEENPYPRWTVVPAPPAPFEIDDDLRRRFPGVPFRGLGVRDSVDVLVAGCGTGQHPIWLARRYRGARILAIDLSLASLSYARRKTRELGVDNIEYAQADITKLAAIGRSFDLIDASGVLHHMSDPFAGWRVLLSLLRPHGLMRVGLYSEAGRRDIAAARELAITRSYRPTVDDIRRCRQELLTSELRSIARFNDFFTTSECRDLLFHVQEHRLTLAPIRSFLESEKLKFIGFELDPRAVAAAAQHFGGDSRFGDLEQWESLENAHPETFAGMYQFWIERR